MDINIKLNVWEQLIENMNIWDDIKNKILNLFKFNDKHHFYKLTNQKIITSFQNIKSYKNIYIVFDIEFQTIITTNMKYLTDKNSKGESIASFPRELGLMVFIRDNDLNMYYVGSIFKNFRDMSEKGIDVNDFKYTLSKYTTVTDETIKKMEQNDTIFNLDLELNALDKGNSTLLLNSDIFKTEKYFSQKKISELVNKSDLTTEDITKIKKILLKVHFNVYRKYLKPPNQKIFDSQMKLYSNDPLTKKRLLSVTDELKLLDAMINISSDSCFIVKGTRDFDTLNNYVIFLKIPNKFNFTHLYDIELFNGFSKLKYNSAQLEYTYNGLINSGFYKQNRTDLDIIKNNISGIAHNPLVDSYYTLVVALIINISLNDTFKTNTVGGNMIYKSQYIKLLNKYKKLKTIE
jgi:hypothetical protein